MSGETFWILPLQLRWWFWNFYLSFYFLLHYFFFCIIFWQIGVKKEGFYICLCLFHLAFALLMHVKVTLKSHSSDFSFNLIKIGIGIAHGAHLEKVRVSRIRVKLPPF